MIDLEELREHPTFASLSTQGDLTTLLDLIGTYRTQLEQERRNLKWSKQQCYDRGEDKHNIFNAGKKLCSRVGSIAFLVSFFSTLVIAALWFFLNLHEFIGATLMAFFIPVLCTGLYSIQNSDSAYASMSRAWFNESNRQSALEEGPDDEDSDE